MIIHPASAAKHLLVDISAHGLGHLAQASAVLNALDCSNVKLTIRSLAPEETLKERIRHPFELVRYQQDNGMIMHDALRVDAERTMEWYNDFHYTYDERRVQAAHQIEALRPDLLFSNVPYLGLDAAGLVGVPSVALCSLNWADIFLSYCGGYSDAARIHDEICNAYSQASQFLRPTPAMPMTGLHNTRPIAPLAFEGKHEPEVLQFMADKDDRTRFVLVGVGGVGIKDFPLETWPFLDHVCWIFPDDVMANPSCPRRDDFIAQSGFNVPYIDLLASCALVLTKTGYGTQLEAVVNQVPSICVNRHDWPEHSYLRAWHEEHGEVAFIDWEDVKSPIFSKLVTEMLGREWTKNEVVPSGAKEAADILHGCLS